MVTAEAGGCGNRLAATEGPATVESDAAVRVPPLWGRRLAQPSGWHGSADPEALPGVPRVRGLLGGY
ncbi:hypothetical protein BIV25_19920 [Streptomyces sp. MUSC 14]|uniref:hypothetical protein n=1 Tax=Streptomyces sp. MUSC 14 TaxID=1354889 RepID=UPI0008F59F5B|nr:hypothetical protein [Streptomyces sp. MUSC 14]OIJ95720.1 hypothetical protein BIV25_19920 [Streptomyces sp. MUSC 14]